MAVNLQGTTRNVTWTSASLCGVQKKTLCWWLYPVQANPAPGAFSRLTGVAGGDEAWIAQFSVNIDSKIYFVQQWTNVAQWNSSLTLSLNVWHHVAIVDDASSSANVPSFYVDGVLASTITDTAPSGTWASGTSGNTMVGTSTGSNPLCNTEDFRLYNRLLSGTEIAALAGAGRTLEMNDNGLVFHAPLLIATGMTPPWAGNTLLGTNKCIDRMNCLQGTPNNSPVGVADAIYGTGY